MAAENLRRPYVRKQDGDLGGSGALLAGKEVNLQFTGDLTNSGTIAGRQVLSLSAQNVDNLGGRIKADAVAVQAREDLNNIGGSISANSQLLATAGRDLNIVTTTQSDSKVAGLSSFSRTHIDRVAGLYVTNPGGTLVASAGRDASVIAGIISNTGQGGNTVISAGRDLNLGTVQTSVQENNVRSSTNYLRQGNSQDIGSQIQATGNVQLGAANNLSARAAQVNSSEGDLTLSAGNSISLSAGESRQTMDEARQHTSKGFLSKKTSTTRETMDRTDAIASNLSGNSVTVLAGKDITIQGSSAVSDSGTTRIAGNNLNIEAAQNTYASSSFKDDKKSGLFSTGGLSVTLGSQQQSSDTKTSQTTAAASTVGSLGGNVTIQAGEAYKQVGSDVVAPGGDIAISAKKVDIIEARETGQTVTEQKFKQSGLSISISNPVLSAAQTGQQLAQAAGNTGDGRMQALAVAAAGFTGYNTYQGLSDKAGNFSADKAAEVSLNISLGSSKSQSNSASQSDTARGSTVSAGGNLTIIASGAGQDSNLTVQGSSITAGNNALLSADGKVNLQASQSTASQTSTNSSRSGSIGASLGSSSGLTFNASASKGQGSGNGQDASNTHTQVSAGNTVILQSGGDTKLNGAVIAANTVQADVGGNLHMASPQDSSRTTSRQSSAGGSLSVSAAGIPTGGGINASKSNIDSRFTSVNQQTAIKAGHGGFQVDVKGNTDLKGAVITSTQAAVDSNKNAFTTGGSLTLSDLQNTASYNANAAGISVSVGKQDGKYGVSGVGAGVGSDQGNASSTSLAGISGTAGNTAVRTGDAPTGLQPIFDAAKVQREIDAQVTITQAFGKEASKAIGTYAKTQLAQAETKQTEGLIKQQQADKATSEGRMNDAVALKAQADAAFQETADLRGQWGETGTARVAMHRLAGLLGGGAGGAVGAAVGTLSAPAIDAAIAQLGLPDSVRNVLVAGAAAALGGAVGGAAGAAGAVNEAANNYLTSQQEVQRDKELTACKTLYCAASVNLRYGGLDAMQNAGLVVGVGGGIGYQSASQAAAIVDLVKNLPETWTALSAIVSDPEFRAKVGDQIADDYKQRIDMQTRAYNDGGWDGSVTAGVEAGRLAVDLFSAATAAVGVGKVVAVTVKAGANGAVAGAALSANATVNFLENMALRNVQVGAINGFKTAEAVNATMKSVAGWEPAWQLGAVVTDVTLKPGTRVSMVVNKADYDLIMAGDTSKFGGWGTYDNVANQAYARNQLAITQGMKSNVGNVIEVEITRPIYAQVGVVGAQGGATGGGSQLHFVIPLGERASIFKVVGGRALP
jgi:filamentous hemagglutinin